MTQFYGKTKICYGEGALDTLEQLPAKQAFLVADPAMVQMGFVDRITTHLDRSGIVCRIFSNVEPDPSLDTVVKGASLFLQDQADLIIAFGGGSAIDAAKAIAFFAHKARESSVKPLLAAIPTTSGTGSEVTAIAVITDSEHGVKIPLNDESLIPDLAILDARFTRTLPASITAATGLDVLTHAVEACTSRQANAFTTIYAECAIRHVFQFLPKAYCCPDDMEAREKMLLASCMAGMAFTNSGLGITHSIAHSLGGLFHVPHGVANAVMLPHVIRYNGFDGGSGYQQIAKGLGLPAASVEEGVTSLIQAVQTLNASLGLPATLHELNIDAAAFETHMDTMACNVLEDFCTGGNPRQPSRSDITLLLQKAW